MPNEPGNDKLNNTSSGNNSDTGSPAVGAGEKNTGKRAAARIEKIDGLFIDKEGNEAHTYTGEELTERDFRPVRTGRESRTGCLGGIMYFVFVCCVSIVLACFCWMAASDALALNSDTFSATVTLPASIFKTVTVDVKDDDGNVTGTKEQSSADIEYVAAELQEAGLIQYKWLFEFFCKLSNADTKFDPGEYELKSSYDYRALVQNMRAGTSAAVTVSVTIPEGYTIEQIFRKLEENGVCSYEELMDAAANANFRYSFLDDSLEGSAERLEGFMFPDTYEFYVDMQASSAINKFLVRFNDVLDADTVKQISDKGMSVKDIVTIASLIEKEAAVITEEGVDERGTVSSVIYNRLNSGMSLGLESAILYVHQDHEGAPTSEMLEEDTPYNLNKNTGLPPTPICNPGDAAIQAALNPETTDYLYFTLDTATSAHRFFRNYNDFLNFVSTQNYG